MLADGFAPYTTDLARTAAASGSPIQRVPATLLFADVSGYTRLTERLAMRGRVGAELLADAVNGCFTVLIDEVHAQHGEVLRFGGDALFIAFTGPGRDRRGRAAAAAMQRAIRDLPSIVAPGGRVRLRQSMGLVDGELRLFRWQQTGADPWVEVLPFGPDVSEVLRCEAQAAAGRLIVGQGGPTGDATTPLPGIESSALLPPTLRRVLSEQARAEHRPVVLAFAQLHRFERLDDTTLTSALDAVMDEVGSIQLELGVNLLGTDVSPDGLKLILATGVPTASHDDEERLLAAAKRLAALDGTLSIRLGAHAGVVFCGDVGHPQRRTYTVMGDAVNTTARLMGAADPGQVLASETLLARVPRSYSITWREPFAVKGKKLPVSAGVLGPPTPHARAVGDDDVKFIGRLAERQQLREALAGDAPLVAVVGPAGIGSTRLVRHVLADQSGRQVHTSARVDGAAVAFSWARHLIDELIGPLSTADLARQLAAAGFDRAADAHAVELALGTASPNGRASADGPNAMVPTLIAALAQPHLTYSLLWVDGADHLDPASSEVVARLAVGIAARGGRLLVTARSSSSVPRPPGVGITQIDLGAMPDDEVRELAVAMAHQPLSRTALHQIVERAGGNPRFTGWLAQTVSIDDDLPITLEAAVLAEFDRLAPAARQAVRAAAVVGDAVDLDLVATVAGDDLPIAELIAFTRPLLVDSPEGARFAYEGARAAVHSALPVGVRRSMHRTAAAQLASRAAADPSVIPRLAEHWWYADEPLETIRWSAVAGDMAVARGATALAVQRYGRALHVAAQRGDSGAVCSLADRLATAADRAGMPAAATRALRLAERHAESPIQRADFMRRRAVQLDWLGRSNAALRLLTAARRLLDAAADTHPVKLEIAIEIATIRFFVNQTAPAFDAARSCIRAADLAGDDRLRARALMVAEMCASTLGLPQSREFGERALALLAGRNDLRALRASLLVNLGVTADNLGSPVAALRYYAAAVHEYEQVGDHRLSAVAMANQAGVLIDLGRIDEALALATRAHRELAAIGSVTEFASAVGVLGRAQCWAGDIAQGDAHLLKSRDTLQSAGDAETTAYRSYWLAESWLLQGRSDDAVAAAASVVEEVPPDAVLHLACRRIIATAHLVEGRSTVGEAALRSLLTDPVPLEEAFVLSALGQFGLLQPHEASRLRTIEVDHGLTAYVRWPRAAPSQRLAR